MDTQDLFSKSKQDDVLVLRNREQIREALSQLNRYYFWKTYNREPLNNQELILFYISSGGAKDYAERHK